MIDVLAGTLLAAVVGWLMGGLVNLAADVLPRYGKPTSLPQTTDSRRLLHFLTLAWYPFRGSACPHCGEPRPIRAPLVEVASVAAYVAAWLLLHDRSAGVLLAAGLYMPFFLAVIVIDVEHRRVLNVMLAPAALISLALSLLPGGPSPLQAVLGGAAGLGLFLLAALLSRGKMGAGDVKLAGVIGLMTGLPAVLPALLLGMLAGGVGALALLLTRRAGLKTYIAYAPYLCFGALAVLARGL